RRFVRILAARVDVARTPQYAFYFEDADAGVTRFYDERGRSLRRAFLRAPLQFRRVSSGFGSRYHPLLHTWRHHEGVDFAAPYGTPVRATADGIVTRVGREDGGYGNVIDVRHANGIRTRYGHLSGFARGLHTGERVEQGETSGYVGSTGLSTGPHLHYELLVNGRPTNPRRTEMGAGTTAPKQRAAVSPPARAAVRWVHFVDLGRALGAGDSRELARRFLADAGEGLLVQVGGALVTEAAIAEMLAWGASRVVIGTGAAIDPTLVSRLLVRHGADRLAVGIDARDGRVAARGSTTVMDLTPVELA